MRRLSSEPAEQLRAIQSSSGGSDGGGSDGGGLGLRRGVFRGLEDLLVLKNRAFYMLLIACLTSSIRPSPRALWPLEVGSCAPLATFPLLLTTNLEFKI